MTRKSDSGAWSLAFSGLMAALGTGLMLLSGLLVVFTYFSPLLASALLIPVRKELGAKWAWMVWIVTAVLTAILCADKEAAFFYVFLGYYPLIKPALDRIRPRWPRRGVKLLVFAAATAAMYAFLYFVFGMRAELDAAFAGGVFALAFFFGTMLALMAMFDLLLRLWEVYYTEKLRPRLGRRNGGGS